MAECTANVRPGAPTNYLNNLAANSALALAGATVAARSFGLAPAFPSGARSYQALTFYPALTYGLDGDRIDSANFRIIGVGNRGLSGIVYRIKVACVCSKQSRRNAWGAGFGKIADAEFHARKIKWQPPISKNRDSQQSRWPRTGLWFEPQGYLQATWRG
jgi:hypothetical protein